MVTGEGMEVLPGTGNPGLDQHVSVYSLVLQVCAPFCVVRPPEVKNKTLAPSLYLCLRFCICRMGTVPRTTWLCTGLKKLPHSQAVHALATLPKYPTENIGHTSVWHSG